MKNQKKTKLWQALGAVIALSAGQAQATTVNFNYTGAFTTWTVPSTGIYNILAFGAQGGHGDGGTLGGLGAKVGGDFNLTSGQVLKIAVGGQGGVRDFGGSFGGSGGGGGSFVVFNANNAILAIAGGGGGTYLSGNGGDGQITSGSGNGGGAVDGDGGGGGGGFNTNGTNGATGTGGLSFLSGLTGGSSSGGGIGGFGGGGGGYSGTGGGGGGGGGYSGGNGNNTNGGGGGGFSKNNATANIVNVAGFQSGNGLVTINYTEAPVPEPEALSLIGLGVVGGVAAQYRRRRRMDFSS